MSDYGYWRIAGTDNWYLCDPDFKLDLDVGTYTIEFKDEEDCISPNNLSINIDRNHHRYEQGIYLCTFYGNLMVLSNKNEEGAQWRVVGTSTWYNCGNETIPLEVKTHEIEFKEIENCITPQNENVLIIKDNIVVLEIEYECVVFGKLVVSSSQIGAQWRIVDDEDWILCDDTLEHDIEVGSYIIEFNEIENCITPQNESVEILENQTSFVNVEYECEGVFNILLKGNCLSVVISNDDDYDYDNEPYYLISSSRDQWIYTLQLTSEYAVPYGVVDERPKSTVNGYKNTYNANINDPIVYNYHYHVRNLNINGHNDWYIPSGYELIRLRALSNHFWAKIKDFGRDGDGNILWCTNPSDHNYPGGYVPDKWMWSSTWGDSVDIVRIYTYWGSYDLEGANASGSTFYGVEWPPAPLLIPIRRVPIYYNLKCAHLYLEHGGCCLGVFNPKYNGVFDQERHIWTNINHTGLGPDENDCIFYDDENLP